MRIRRWLLDRNYVKDKDYCKDRFKRTTSLIGLIAYITSDEDIIAIRNFEKYSIDKGFLVTLLLFSKRSFPSFPDIVTNKSVSFLGKPNGELVDHFLECDFDQLWVASTKVTLPMQYVISRTKSRLKLAPFINQTYRDCHIFTHSNDSSVKDIIEALKNIMIKLNQYG